MPRNIAQDFMQGWQFAQGVKDHARDQAIQTEDRARAISLQDEDMSMRREERTRARERESMNKDTHEAQLDRINQQTEIGRLELDNAKKADLARRAQQSWKKFELTGKMPPVEEYQELSKYGMGDYSPWGWEDGRKRDSALKLKPILSQVANGNVRAINTPDALAIMTSVYQDDLHEGVGEVKYPTRLKIAKKEFAGFEIVPGTGGKLAANLRVTLEDGSTYQAKLSEGRGSDPDDPIRLFDPSEMLDDAMARYAIASSFTPDKLALMKSAKEAVFGSADDSSGTMSATGKTISDLTRWGVSKEDAIAFATTAKRDPQAAIVKMASAIMAGGLFDGTASDAISEAQSAMSVLGGERPKAPANDNADAFLDSVIGAKEPISEPPRQTPPQSSVNDQPAIDPRSRAIMDAYSAASDELAATPPGRNTADRRAELESTISDIRTLMRRYGISPPQTAVSDTQGERAGRGQTPRAIQTAESRRAAEESRLAEIEARLGLTGVAAR